jgi:hypothetical protein
VSKKLIYLPQIYAQIFKYQNIFAGICLGRLAGERHFDMGDAIICHGDRYLAYFKNY